MQIRKILTTFILSLFFIASFAYAEVTTKGIGTIQMKSNDPTNVETEEAKNNAIKSAWKSFVSKFNPSKMKQYNLVKEDIEQNIDEYIISSEVVENIIDQGTKTLKTIIKIKINDTAINNKLSTLSAAGQTASGDNSGIVGIFITRELESRRSFKEKKVDIAATKEAKSVSESMQGCTDSIEAESFAKKETGGSTTQKSDKLIYKKSSNTISPEVIADNMNNVLGDFMFEVTEYDEFSADYDAPERLTLENEFIKDNRLSRPTKKSVSDMMKLIRIEEPEFKYLLTTILDTDQAFTDPTSGNQKVVVNISARVQSFEKKRPKTVASFTTQAFGMGPNEKSATLNALKNASNVTAKTLVDKLNAKGLN